MKKCKRGHPYERTPAGNSCAVCARERACKWAADNPERVKANKARWYSDNKERAQDNKRAWRERNIAAIKIYQRKRYDPVKQKAWNAKHYQENRDERIAYAREWKRRKRRRGAA